MHRERTIVLNKDSRPHDEEDDLSTLSDGSYNSVRRPLAHQSQPNRKSKDKLHSYLLSKGKNISNNKHGHTQNAVNQATNVPFDEDPMILPINLDETYSDSEDDSGIDPDLESWEVQADGNLELAPRPQNKFEKSKKSAFVSTLSHSSEDRTIASTNTNDTRSPEKRKTRLQRLRQRNGRLLSKTSYCQKYQRNKGTPSQGQTFNGESDLSDIKQTMSKLQLKLQEAESANHTNRLLFEEISNPDSDGMNSFNRSKKHEMVDDNEGSRPVATPTSPHKSQFLRHYQSLSKQIQPRSPGGRSSVSADTRTTECTSSTATLMNQNGYTSLNTAGLKERFHSQHYLGTPKSKENESHSYSSPEYFGQNDDDDNKLDFDTLTSPPKMRRRCDFLLLSEAAESCDSASQHDEVNEPKSTSTSLQSSKDVDSTEFDHTIHFSIELSGKSLPLLKNIVNNIEKDLDQYKLDNDTLSIKTKYDSDTNKVQFTKDERNNDTLNEKFQQVMVGMNPSKQTDTKTNNVLSISTDSLLQSVRQAVHDSTIKTVTDNN